jgi:AcrR family transcriptional regulator
MLRAAEELLREGGWSAVTPAAVAERAGAGKMSLYRHFDGKDDLVVEALRDLDARQLERLFVRGAGEPAGPRERVLAPFDRMAGLAERGELTACVYVTTLLQLKRESGHAAVEVGRRHKSKVASEFTRLLTELGHPAPEDVGRALIMLLDGAIVHSVFEGSAAPMHSAAATARLLLDA